MKVTSYYITTLATLLFILATMSIPGTNAVDEDGKLRFEWFLGGGTAGGHGNGSLQKTYDDIIDMAENIKKK